jgi:hypothetical protein
MKFELYINNHEHQKGIEDYIFSIKNVFSKNNIKINAVKSISKDVEVLFVIENFAKFPKELLKFIEDSKFKPIKICFVHTEFINKEKYFNTFTPKEILFRRCLFTNILSYFYQFENRDYRKLLLYFLIFIYVIFGLILGFNFLEIKKRIIFALRDHNYSKLVNIADYNITLSDDLYKSLNKNTKLKNIFYLQDYFDINIIKKFQSKDLKRNLLYQTGYKTPYRRKVIRSQDKYQYNNFFIKDKIYPNEYNFAKKGTTEFNLLFTKESVINNLIKIYKNKYKTNINKFEIYIPQRKNWPYVSTTRIIRAFRNESIPINVGKYNRSNYESLCINIKNLDYFIKNYDLLINEYLSKLEINIQEFNSESDNLFNYFIENIIDTTN